MKKIYKSISALFAMLLVALVTPAVAFAQWSWHDDFGDYVTGSELAGNGSWWQYKTTDTSPIMVGAEPLAYEGYPGGVTGKSIVLKPATSTYGANQCVYTVFNDDYDGAAEAEQHRGITKGSVYYSVLLNVKSAPASTMPAMSSYFYIASFVTRGSTGADLANNSTGTEKGKFHIKSSGDGYVLGVNCTGAATNIAYTGELEYGKTYLAVVKYTVNPELNGKDGISLFIDPVDFKTEPATPTASVALGTGTGGIALNRTKGYLGIQGLEFRQGYGVEAEVSSVRIADTWAGLFEVKSTADAPRIIASPANIDFGNLLQGAKAEKVVNVRGKNLKGNISVKVPEGSNLSVSATEIPQDAAMSEAGFDLTVSLDVKNPSLGKETIVLSSDEADDCAISTACNALPVSDLATLQAFYGQDVKPGTIYRLATKSVISHVQEISVAEEVEGGVIYMKSYYLQDETAGVVLVDPYLVLADSAYAKGDAFEGLTAEVKSGAEYGYDFNVLVPVTRAISSRLVPFSHAESVTRGTEVTPLNVTLDQLNANPAAYFNRLVRVARVNIEEADGDLVFAATNTLTLTDGKNRAGVLPFRGTTGDDGKTSSDILGETVPAGIINLTGISTSSEKSLIQPRGIADVEEVETSTLGITVNGETVALTVRAQEEGELPVVMSELTLNDNTQSLSVTAPFVAPGVEYVRDFSNTEWQALYVPFAVDCEAWAADCDLAEIYNMHQYDDDENGTIDRTELEVIKKVSGQLLPNTPYLIRAKEAGEKTLKLADVTIMPTAQASIDCSSTKVTYAFNGIYNALSGSAMMDGGFYALSNGEIMQAASSEAGLHAFRWYMTATDRNGNPAPVQSIRIRLRGENNLNTGINDAMVVVPGQQNGIYDLSGRRVEKAAKGVYIVGGKKVIVK